MSDTPRTEQQTGVDVMSRYVPADFARQLERELAAVTRERDDARLHADAEAIMCDLVAKERDALRANRDYWQEECQKAWTHRDNANAAAEVDKAQIDALRAEVERLRGALSSIAEQDYERAAVNFCAATCVQIARAALQEPTP